MAKIERFEDLQCWQEARVMVKMVYEASGSGLISKDFELRGQIRSAALSSMSNAAEGFGRFSNKEFIRFLEIATSSAIEVKSIVYAAFDLGYWDNTTTESIQHKAEEVKSLCLGLIKYLKCRNK
jgi:four helix bundle protein